MSRNLVVIGAGVEPDLVTMKGIKALKRADVLLYESNCAHAFLGFVSSACKQVMVEKDLFTQAELHDLLLFFCSRYDNVAYLKEGDAYFFEESTPDWDYLRRNEVDVDVIPGIPNVVASLSQAGIPLTSRGVNESFCVFKYSGVISSNHDDLRLAAQSHATVVLQLDRSDVHTVLNLFCRSRGEQEPVIISDEGKNLKHETLGTALHVQLNKNSSSIILVIGEVVNESTMINALKEKSLLSRVSP